MLTSAEEEQPVFAEVLDVYIYNHKPILYTRLFETEHYNHHYHCYVVKPKSVFKVLDTELLYRPYVFHMRKLQSSTVMVLKHCISGTVIGV